MRKRILCDPTLLFAVIVFAVVSSIAVVGTMFGVVHEESVATSSEMIAIRIMFGVLLLGLWLSLIFSSPRYLCVLTLSNTTIAVWTPFKKRKDLSYTQFRFVYCGKYFHGNIAGMGRSVWYIVIAQRRLSTNELSAINHIPNSEEVVKIRYSKKTVKKLKSIFPAKLIVQLDCAITKTIT